MAAFPQSKTDDIIALRRGRLLILQLSDGREIARLEPITAAVWSLADGATAVDAIAEGASLLVGGPVDPEQVWSALDFLADVGLCAERITPPAGTSAPLRRGIIQVIGGAFGAGALVNRPAWAQGGEQQSKERSSKESRERESYSKESGGKERQSKDRAQESAGKRMQEEVNKSRPRR